MNDSFPDFESLCGQFREALAACRAVYSESALECLAACRELPEDERRSFVARMEELHRGLVVKAYVSVATVDGKWSPQERRLAEIMVEHVWGQKLSKRELSEAMAGFAEKSLAIRWTTVLQPFLEVPALRRHGSTIASITMRIANITAKADGVLGEVEQRLLKSLQEEFDIQFGAVVRRPPSAPSDSTSSPPRIESNELRLGPAPTTTAVTQPPASLVDLMSQLDTLIGLDGVKQEVRTLANVVRLRQQRKDLGLEESPLSLHMVFMGNPGTGKTTVARLIGRLLHAMGVLQSGHLVETDRSGLVAQYAGQTAARTHQCVDKALDGVLFIDEAYSLVNEEGDDPYGQESIQCLLKRIEDDRHRLVVILAGYPDPMRRLLRTNPGLQSRFHRVLDFVDYAPLELARIFAQLCDQQKYSLTPDVRGRLTFGFHHLHRRRDAHFGNGRLARNTFEEAIRRMANRIATITPVTRQLLTEFHPQDIHFESLDAEQFPGSWDDVRYRVSCPHCESSATIRHDHLGKNVRCRNCQKPFAADWGEIQLP